MPRRKGSSAKRKATRSPRQRVIAKYMRKFKHRTLRSGNGRKGGHHKVPVMKRSQAIAIALSVASKKYGPYIPKTDRGWRSAAQRAALHRKNTKIG
jgi:hypothetical protein